MSATARASSRDGGGSARRLRDVQLRQQRGEPLPVFGEIDGVGRRAENPHARLLKRQRELERRLPAELDEARHFSAGRAFRLDHRHHVFEGQRLEVQTIGRVVIRRDRLGIAVDHHRLEAFVAQRERGVAAAVVELDALPDPVRTAAENHDLVPRRRVRFAVGSYEL